MPEYRVRVSVSVAAYGEQFPTELEQSTRYFTISASSAEMAMRSVSGMISGLPLLTVDAYEERKRAEAADAS